ncbi:MAG: 1-deoxy-D-xylulose-5-phosphate synthase [Oscillospiraceae bacterium]|nr:1-deoxy-D-xylulose-5-phosphate synthase [Oscillospiraceae bacterium]
MNENTVQSEKRPSLASMQLPEHLKKLSLEQCQLLCKDIRSLLVQTVSKNGGHLASNLGVVELTVSMHRVFDSPQDKFVWDVGHQCYTHKILTGRYAQFATLRQEKGISGFPKPEESPHDTFISGHSSTAISVASGIAEAMRLDENPHHVIAVLGDGAMTGGLAFEGLNNAGKSKNHLIVILNDNAMSISKNVGSVAKYLSNIRGSENYVKTKKAVERKLQKTPVIGAPVAKMLKSSKDALRDTVFRSATIFEDFGFVYLGPVDGHNLEDLEEVLQAAKTYACPVFVHVHTVKGKGYLPSEKNPGEFHGISRFNVETGNPEISGRDTYSDIFGKELVRLAKKDDSICAITAAMEHGTGLQYFSRTYPQRYYDVGIAEQHAVTFAAALASQGKLPVFAVYSSFLQRAYDQLLHDVAIGKLHVVLGIDRAGVVGEDGETHHGLFDISFLTSIPGTTIYAPACYDELTLCLRQAMYQDTGLACVRYPRGADNTVFDKSALNTAYTHTAGSRTDVLLIGYGRTYDNLYRAKKKAEQQGICCDLLKLTQIFPLPELISELCCSYQHILFFEEAYYYGGISQLLGDILMQKGYHGAYQRIAPKQFIPQATISSQLEQIGLSEAAMLQTIRETVLQTAKEQPV